MKIVKFILVGFVFLQFQNPIFAATYRAISLHTQVSESSGLVVGKYLGQSYKKIGDNLVVTEASFQLDLISGLDVDQIKNPQNFKVHFPGGVWQGIVYSYEGMPKFIKDKKYLLLVSNDGYGHSLTSQSLGVYEDTSEFNQAPLFKSVVFPDHVELGAITLDTMNDLSNNLLDGPLRKPQDEKRVSIATKSLENSSNDRSPAALDENKPQEKNSVDTFWIVFLFSILGTMTIIFARKSRG